MTRSWAHIKPLLNKVITPKRDNLIDAFMIFGPNLINQNILAQ